MPLRRIREAFDDPKWQWELKADGWRALAFIDGGQCRLVSRNGHVLKGWPFLCAAIASSVRAKRAILDGEVACLDAEGKSDFRALMFRRRAPVLIAFDLVMLDGKDLRGEALMARKKMLRRIVPRRAERLMYLDHVVARGVDLFRAVCEVDAEGVVGKLRSGTYDPDVPTWVKCLNRGYTQRERHQLLERRTVGGQR
jgi:bifunctional non-homologous end joining protein LigD